MRIRKFSLSLSEEHMAITMARSLSVLVQLS
jgi:hypothetical protein